MPNKDLSELISKIAKFSADRDWNQFHSPKNLSMAVAAEAGELLEEFMWLTEEQSKSLTSDQSERVQDEIGDVLICLLNLCHKLKIDVLDAAFQKLDKNQKKYPVEKSKGKASKYDKL